MFKRCLYVFESKNEEDIVGCSYRLVEWSLFFSIVLNKVNFNYLFQSFVSFLLNLFFNLI